MPLTAGHLAAAVRGQTVLLPA